MMRTWSKIIAVSAFLALGACETDYSSGSLPMVYLETQSTIRPDDKVSGNMSVEIDGNSVFSSRLGVEYRGSTSYRLSDKKGMGLTLRQKNGNSVSKSILGMPAESDWVLMGHVFRATGPDEYMALDPTLMHHYLGYELARNIGMYASRCRWVELTVNDEYQGIYILMEKLKNDRLRIDVGTAMGRSGNGLTGGYILKIDKTGSYAPSGQELSYYDNNWGDDANYTSSISFRSDYDVFGEELSIEPFRPPYHDQQYLETYFLLEHPKPRDLKVEQRRYIEGYVHDFESALLSDDLTGSTRTYTDYIDLESFADGFILNELAGNIDAYRISTYLHKPRGGKLRFGPIWDLNIGYGRQGRVPWDDWIANYNDHVNQDAWMVPFWWDRLLDDPVFRGLVKERWTTYRQGALSNSAILNLVDDTENRLVSSGAVARNYEKWRAENATVNYGDEVDFLRYYLEERLNWMDSEIQSW